MGGGIITGSRLLTGGGYLLGVPAIDLAEVGAGGGSILWIDTGGSLQAGPKSCRACPGPACYGLGGEAPTVTDANVVLGYLNPSFLCGGEVKIDAGRSRQALESKIAGPLGLEIEHAAWAARQVAIANMIRAIRAVSSERGRDPRSYVLFAFGGNGALFAAGMAAELGMTRVIVPPAAGLFSAFGLLYADIEHHYSRTVRRLLRDSDPEEVEALYRELEALADAQLASEGFDASRRRCERTAMLHYQGQIYELEVPIAADRVDRGGLERLAEDFGREHARTYGHRAGDDEPVELVTVQVLGRGLSEESRVPDSLNLSARDLESGSRRAYHGRAFGWMDTPVLARSALAGGVDGPCIVEEYDSTCLVPPGVRAELDPAGNLLLSL